MASAKTKGTITLRQAWQSLLYHLFGQTWSDAIKEEEFGIIADWFATYFFLIGIFALTIVGIAAGLDGQDGLGLETQATFTSSSTAGQTPPDTGRGAPQTDAKSGPTSAKPTGHQAPVSKHAIAQTCSDDLCRWGLGLRVSSLALLLAGACMSIGWLFGLLFGIPKGSNAPSSSSAPNSNSSRQVNTNLVEISDWLTKTIVGVGLTQLTFFPKFLGDLAASINRFGLQWGDHGQLVALGVILYFLPGGFWLGYVGTRTLLTGLFDGFAIPKAQVDLAAAPESLQIDKNNNIMPASAGIRSIDSALLSVPIQTLQTQEQVVAWASAQARNGNLAAAESALENALANDPNNAEIGRQLLKVYIAESKINDAVQLAQKLPDSPPKLLAMLYAPAPQGFQEAIAIGERILTDPAAQKSASVHVWVASGYGQKYTYQLAHGAPGDDLKKTLEAVEQHAIAAVRLDPTTRALLASLWKPGASTENDLQDIPKDNPTMTNIRDGLPV
jgi:Tetratricopeptide repeat